MEETQETKNIGLRGIKVADTRISDVDGEKGNLIYRGLNICDLVSYSTFEEVSFLLLNNRLPTAGELKNFQAELVSERKVPDSLFSNREYNILPFSFGPPFMPLLIRHPQHILFPFNIKIDSNIFCRPLTILNTHLPPGPLKDTDPHHSCRWIFRLEPEGNFLLIRFWHRNTPFLDKDHLTDR